MLLTSASAWTASFLVALLSAQGLCRTARDGVSLTPLGPQPLYTTTPRVTCSLHLLATELVGTTGAAVPLDWEGDASDTIRIYFENGWSRLLVSDGRTSDTFVATNLVDFFGDLVSAVLDLAAGRRSVSCLWGGEPGGVFIDLARSGPTKFSLVVHQIADPDWISGATEWTPRRGEVICEQSLNSSELIRGFTREFRRVLQDYVDPTGFMPQWGWVFPQRQFGALEEMSMRLGHRPEPAPRTQSRHSSGHNQ